MAKEYRYSFTVQGHMEFPLDMLRYDACWPYRESEDVPAIAASLNPRVKTETRKVSLVGVKQPTEGRWASFGWRVLEWKRFALT